MPTPSGPVPVVDAVFTQIINTGRHNIPMVDYHVHLKEGLTLEAALAKSRRDTGQRREPEPPHKMAGTREPAACSDVLKGAREVTS